MSAKALYPGTFDPPTNGHVDLIQRGSKLFEHLTVAVLNNPGKNPLFPVSERVEMLQEATRALDNVSVATFDGLMVDFARSIGASAVLLTARILAKSTLQHMIETTLRHELTPFVEIADHEELASVVHAEECIVAINNKDIPVIQGVAVITALVFVLANLAVDISYPLVDPRVGRS